MTVRKKKVTFAAAITVTALLFMAGCDQKNENNLKSTTDMSEIKDASESFFSENDIEEQSTAVESLYFAKGTFIELSYDTEVYEPDELNVYEGDTFYFEDEDARVDFVKRHFPEYEARQDKIEHVVSNTWGDIYKYALGEDPGDVEKIQFLTNYNILYYRKNTDNISELDQDAYDLAAEFVEDFYSDINFKADKLYIETAEDATTLKFVVTLDGIDSETEMISYGGNDRFYAGEHVSVSVDDEGVNNCQNTILLKNHDIAESYEKGEYLSANDALEKLLQVLDFPGVYGYVVDAMELKYCISPIKGVDESERMRCIPLWRIDSRSIDGYNENEDGTKEPIYSLPVAYYVDAVNGEVY